MKKNRLFLSGLIIAAIAVSAFTVGNLPAELEIGATLPKSDLKMKDVTGKEVSMIEQKQENGLLVIFSCNTCPYVSMYANRIDEAILQAGASKVGTIIINSNEAYRGNEDSFDAMKKYAGDRKFTVPYVVDVNCVVADAFGATRTPQVFLFNGSGKLVYKGAIDDNPKETGVVKSFFLRDALRELRDGKEVTVKSSKSVGCSIKRPGNGTK